MKSLLLLVAIICLYYSQNNAAAQENISKYPLQYFRNPLDIPISLAGNFGECRPNHFHSGLDIKTEGKENFAIHAAADGYVSRMKIEKGGFGHALYVTHPNGFTTLYAHLNDFNPALQTFLRKKQYEKQSWTVDQSFSPADFPVKKGDQIAWSGNTGGSLAPHLHFEIRDSKTEHPLNPQLFGFEINDTRAPIPTEIAIYNLDQRFYERTPLYFKLIKSGESSYTTSEKIQAPGTKIGIGVDVNDFMNGSTNTLNFYKAAWYLDDVRQGGIALDDIGYHETRYLHAYADYRSLKQKSSWFQCMFRLPGNRLNIYDGLNSSDGALNISTGEHQVRLELTDAAQNKTTIEFTITSMADSVKKDCNNVLTYNKVQELHPYPNLQLNVGDKTFYDDVCFNVTRKGNDHNFSDTYEILQNYIPAHEYFTVRIRPNKPIPFTQRDKIVMVYKNENSESAKAAVADNAWYKASVRNFGAYYLKADITPPVITSLQKTAKLASAATIRFEVKEETTSVKDFRAELDGKWILFEPFGNTYVYKFDEYCSKGKHELHVTVKDENDNQRTFNYSFTR